MASSDQFDDTASIGLLPTGLSDLLDPEASKDADATAAVLSCFQQFGYARVKPPLWNLKIVFCMMGLVLRLHKNHSG